MTPLAFLYQQENIFILEQVQEIWYESITYELILKVN